MDIVDQLRAFVATAQTGSFTAAADQLGISNRLTSKYVAELEARLGVRLFQRTTRKVGLTPAGGDLLARAPALLDDLDDLLSGVSAGGRGFSGVLRVSAPVTFGEIYLVGMLGRFAALLPGIVMDLRLGDAYADLATGGIDLAFRLGSFDLTSLKVRRFGAFGTLVVASPDYVAQHKAPRVPADLADHRCIVDTNRRNGRAWSFTRDGRRETVTVAARFQVNSAKGAVGLARQGIGIAYVPRFALGDAMRQGDLMALLPDYRGDSVPLGAVWLEGRALPRKVRALIDFAGRDLRQSGLVQADGGPLPGQPGLPSDP